MQVDHSLFPSNAIDLQNTKVLVWLEHADSTKGKSMIINEDPKKLGWYILAKGNDA
jgi:hypothetical protein